MNAAVVTVTRRYGGIDLARACLDSLDRPVTWILMDELLPSRPVESWGKVTVVQRKPTGGRLKTSCRGYNMAVDIARDLDVDLLVSVQDYIWFPPDGVDVFEAAAVDSPVLLTGICSHSEKPTAKDVRDRRDPYSIFREPLTAAKPEGESWRDPRQDWYRDGECINPEHWELNWAAIPRGPLYHPELFFDERYDDGHGYENADYALRAARLGFPSVLVDNRALALPHKNYFPGDDEWLASINNRRVFEAAAR